MQQLTLLAPQTAEFGPFGLTTIKFDASRYEWVIFAADALGEGEYVDVANTTGTGNLAGTDVADVTEEDSAPVQLTPACPSRVFAGGVQYHLHKSATAAACGVYVQLGPPARKRG